MKNTAWTENRRDVLLGLGWLPEIKDVRKEWKSFLVSVRKTKMSYACISKITGFSLSPIQKDVQMFRLDRIEKKGACRLFVFYKDKRVSLQQLSKNTGIPYSTLYHMIVTKGVCPGDAVNKNHDRRPYLFFHKGEIMNMRQIANMEGVNYSTLRHRIREGQTVSKAIRPAIRPGWI